MGKLLHQFSFLDKLLYNSRVSTGECLHSHWNITRVASYVLFKIINTNVMLIMMEEECAI